MSEMRFLDEEIAKYARRVKKITENPNPNMAASNKLLYEGFLRLRSEQLENWEKGKPCCHVEGICWHLPYALGFGASTFLLESLGDRVAGAQVKRYFDSVREKGLTPDTCDRVQLGAGVAVSGEVPPPTFALVPSNECDSIVQECLWSGRYWKCPSYAFDIPLDFTWEAVQYVVEQIYDMIRFAEENVPGVKFSEERLLEIQDAERINQVYGDRIAKELCKHKPSPLRSRDILRMPPYELEIYHDLFGEYVKAFYDELAAKLDKPGPEEKRRVYWTTTSPFWFDSLGYVNELGSMVVFEEGPGIATHWHFGNEAFGRKLTPLEEEAALMTSCHWAARAKERRMDETIRWCRELDIDTIVHYQQVGCATCNGCARIISEEAEKQLGVTSLIMDGWCQDYERIGEEEFKDRVGEFMSSISGL